VSSSGCESPAAFVAGFCGETEEEHAATVDLMRSTNYDSAFMFAYSQRDKTAAARHLEVRSGRYMLKIQFRVALAALFIFRPVLPLDAAPARDMQLQGYCKLPCLCASACFCLSAAPVKALLLLAARLP